MAMRDVELVEADPGEPDEAGPERASGRSWLRSHPKVVAVLASAVVVTVGTGAFFEVRAQRADAARAHALGQVPGVVRPVDPALRVVERIPARAGTDLTAVDQALVGGAVPTVTGVAVVGLDTADGTATIAGVRPAQRTEVWRSTLDPPPAADPEQSAQVSCSAPGTGTYPELRTADTPVPGLVGCVAQWSQQVDLRVHPDGVALALVVAVEVDPTDGRVVHRVPLPDGASTARLDDGWIVTLQDATGVRASRLAGDGTTLWSTTLEVPPTHEDPWAAAAVRDGQVVITYDAGSVLLDQATGATTAQWAGAEHVSAALLDGGLVVTSGPGGSRLHREAGEPVTFPDEYLRGTTVDDGSLGDVLLTSGEDGTTLAGTDGTVRWRAPVAVRNVMVVDGSVVAVTDEELVRVAGTDGRVLWRAPVAGPRPQLLTDGAVILVGTSSRIDAWTFDGTHAWSGHLRRGEGTFHLAAGEPPPTSQPPTAPGASWFPLSDRRLAVQVRDPSGVQTLVVG